MVAELGAGYLTYAAEVLQGALPDKGSTAQLHAARAAGGAGPGEIELALRA